MEEDTLSKHCIEHVHYRSKDDNPEIYRVLTVTAPDHTVDIRTTFENENFEHLIGVYEKVMNKIKEVKKE